MHSNKPLQTHARKNLRNYKAMGNAWENIEFSLTLNEVVFENFSLFYNKLV